MKELVVLVLEGTLEDGMDVAFETTEVENDGTGVEIEFEILVDNTGNEVALETVPV